MGLGMGGANSGFSEGLPEKTNWRDGITTHSSLTYLDWYFTSLTLIDRPMPPKSQVCKA